MRIAVFDYRVIPTNPIGGCHWRMLRGLCQEHEFTVFALEFDNPCPERIKFVRVPAPKRPLALCFILFHLLAPICFLFYKIRHRVRFDLVQAVESNMSFGDISYTQFCHRTFLRKFRDRIAGKGLAYRFRLMDHWLHACLEPWVFRRVKLIIVPSRGLATEIKEEYPFASEKVVVLPNPIDIARMSRPPDFNRTQQRQKWGLDSNDLALTFVALGHFERKGLPQLLSAMAELPELNLKLIVVGGREHLQKDYRRRCKELGLADRVVFVGMQNDVRPFLWMADAFVFPSFYETFSLVSFEAAAAGLPLIVSRIYGVEDFILDGRNGILVAPERDSIAVNLRRFAMNSTEERNALGSCAASSVRQYDVAGFVANWKSAYATLCHQAPNN